MKVVNAMNLYRGGMTVSRGTYWNPVDGHQVDMKDEGSLPGDGGTRYLRMPPGGLLVVAPVLGLMYVFFLPLFGIGTVLMAWLAAAIGVCTTVVLAGIKVSSSMVGRNASFGWSPTATFLSGKRRRKRKTNRR
jgi:hypothetical protein